MMQRRRSVVREGETADGALDRMIAEAQRERGGRAHSVPRAAEGGLRRLELQAAEPQGGEGARGRDAVPRPAGLPQALAGCSSWRGTAVGRTSPRRWSGARCANVEREAPRFHHLDWLRLGMAQFLGH